MTEHPGARITRISVRTALSRSGLPDLDYSLNPYVGCSHGCLYCYARDYTRRPEVAENWGFLVCVKENLLSILERETRKLRPGTVGISTITDPYQPVESVEKLTRRSIELLLKRGFRVSIQTKSPLVLRDIDILRSFRDMVDVGFTIITLDSSVASLLEPGAPSPAQRVRALTKVSEEGLKTWLFYGPVVPGFNDDVASFARVLEAVYGHVSLVLMDKLRVTPRVRSSLGSVVGDFEKIESLASNKTWWSSVVKAFTEICARLAVKCVASLAEPPSERIRGLEVFSRKRGS
ncbi:MAG: radical SAM protein [Sulfolobales archaeon]